MEINIISIVLSITNIFVIFALIYLFLRLRKLDRLYKVLTKDVEIGNIEELLKEYLKIVDLNKQDILSIDKKIDLFIKKSETHIQKIEFKRFNPFHETGGNQSFILLLLDRKNNGVLISSLHQRDVTRVYSKYILEGRCKNKLSIEEKEILSKVINNK